MPASHTAAAPTELKEEIARSGMVAYCWDQNFYGRVRECTTTKDNQASTHGTVHNGKVIDCLVGSCVIPAGTKGWCYFSSEQGYDKYVRVDDMDLPAKDAKVTWRKTYYTFFAWVEVDGHRLLAHSFEVVEKTF